MQKIKISAVSYLNTIPFLYGIENSGYLDPENYLLELDYPSVCAEKMIRKQVDICLLPVGAIPHVADAHNVTDFCIGANQKVTSVLLLSDVPLNEIEYVLLDYQSRTSVNLVKILANKHWQISPEWQPAKLGFESEIGGRTAGVVIGDRCFDLSTNFKYCYDLAEEWINFSSKPFVFACWMAYSNVQMEFIDKLNSALRYGVNNTDKAVQSWYSEKNITKEIALKYLTSNISYSFDEDKKVGMNYFLSCLRELDNKGL